MSSRYFIPDEETLDAGKLAILQLEKLRAMLRDVLTSNRFYRAKLGDDFDPEALQTLEDLESLPFTEKSELVTDQAEHPPYGTNLTYPLEAYVRLHQTSGTSGGRKMRWLDTPESWEWIMRCWGMIYSAVGIEKSDRFFFPFSFGPFIGFWAAFEAACRRGNLALPGGGMTSAARIQFLLDNRATVVGCTPTYALHLAEVAREEGLDLAGSPVRALIVAGEPGGNIPETKEGIEKAWGARCFDHSGMTEVGSLGIECVEDRGNTHLLGSECIYEIVDSETGEARGQGELGELVLTTLGRIGSPLIRYRTGDLVRLTYERCACGRGFARMLGGILGRADDMMIIRGNNIYPGAIEAIVRRFPEISEFRIHVDEAAQMATLTLQVEPVPAAEDSFPDILRKLGQAFKNAFNFRAEIRPVPPGTLPRFELKASRLQRK